MERFQKSKKKKQSVLVISIVFVLLIAGVILYRTYSLFEKKENYNVIKGSIPNYIENYDIKINFQLDGVNIQELPEKKGVSVENISCDKGASGSWDYLNWNFNVQNLSQTRTTCTINFIRRYREEILNGADPVVKDELIPVTIENDGIVKKVDVKEKWYEYQNQEWANAVILSDPNIMYQNGDIIPEESIESYFVWIPRYKYQIFNEGNYIGNVSSVVNAAKIINIEFENKDTLKSAGSTVGSWLTHPAFTAFETNGMWVGKFETGYRDAGSKEEAEKNENNPGKVQIKADIHSWRGINVANAYLTSYNYKQNLNSHMMKNTEWGAVSYLQHSQYGSHDRVRINNNSEYKTGYAGVHNPTTGATGTNISCSMTPSACNEYGTSSDITRPWNTSTGYLASTTGNISGVYDMSGGAWEYVMGVMMNRSGIPCSGRDAIANSGFQGPYCTNTEFNANGIPFPIDQRYFDAYAYALDDEHYNRRILGDATGEIGPFIDQKYGVQTRQIGSWYDNEAWFVCPDYPWFHRGSGFTFGIGSGVFSFDYGTGSAWQNHGFRVVLSI